jgi:hypothetical protein
VRWKKAGPRVGRQRSSSSAASQSRRGRHCHSTLSLTAIGCHSLGMIVHTNRAVTAVIFCQKWHLGYHGSRALRDRRRPHLDDELQLCPARQREPCPARTPSAERRHRNHARAPARPSWVATPHASHGISCMSQVSRDIACMSHGIACMSHGIDCMSRARRARPGSRP